MNTKIDSDVLTVLDKCTIEGNGLVLPDQLPRDLYTKVNKILTILGGKWNKSAKAHLFDENPANVVYDAITTGYVIDDKKKYQQFFTPDKLADDLVEFAQINSASTILEPSAGAGAIIKAIQRRYDGKHISAVDIDPELCDALEVFPCEIYNSDFTATRLMSMFDAVVMNPPFTGLQDVKHVQQAWEYVKEGGSLTAIMSPGWTFRNDKLCTAFREFLNSGTGYTMKEIDAGEFKESGTSIRTVMIRKVK